MISCIEIDLFLYRKKPQYRFLRVSRNLEKFASGAAGAEIFRNLPLTAPLHASQAHAVHMYRISILERCICRYGPRSQGGLRQCLTSNCLAIFGPSPPQPRRARGARRVPRAALAHRAPPSSPAPPHPRRARSVSFDTRARPPTMGRLHASRIHGAVYRTCRPRRGRSGSGCSRRLPSGPQIFNSGASVTRAFRILSESPPHRGQSTREMVW